MTYFPSKNEKLFNELVRNHNDEESTIIPGFLYLGGHNSVKYVNKLIAKSVTHVLNMAGELYLDSAQMNRNNIKLLHIEAKDTKTYNIRQDFDRAFKFMDEALIKKGKIIVNCARGVSRSATIVLAYLMFRYNFNLADAYKLVIKLRPQVRPNSNFRRILEMYEQELFVKRYKTFVDNRTLMPKIL